MGKHALRLCPEERPDRGFDWAESEPPPPSGERSPCRQETNGADTLIVLTDTRSIRVIDIKAPRGVLNSNRGFVELGSYALNRLHRKPIIEFYAWNAPRTSKNEQNDPGKADRDRLRLARYYQSLLDTGKFESRAALARFLAVSRARVTQVLNRLHNTSEMPPSSAGRPDDLQKSYVG
jgi:hypothetical protein